MTKEEIDFELAKLEKEEEELFENISKSFKELNKNIEVSMSMFQDQIKFEEYQRAKSN